MRCDAGHFFLELLDGPVNRRPAHSRGPAAEGPDADGNLKGVAVIHGHVVVRDAKPVGDDLREAGLFALAVRRSAAEHSDLARRVHAHRAEFPAACRHPA